MDLDETGVNEIAKVLENNLERLGGSSDAFDAASQLEAVDHEVGFAILDFFANFCISRLSRAKDSQEVVDAVLSNLSRSEIEPKFNSGELKKLEKRLKRVLSNPTVALKSKAIRLQTSHDKVFMSSEIISDIRPVYSVNGIAKIDAVMTFHMLHIEYHNNGERASFYCALDSKDLKELREALDRATEKEATIDRLLDISDHKRVFTI